MNFRQAYEQGQKGANKGLPMGPGLSSVAQAINDIQRAKIYTVAAAPKGGKSTLVDSGFVIEPAVYVLEHNKKIHSKLESIKQELDLTLDSSLRSNLNTKYDALVKQLIDLEFIYNSYEIDRVSKEFDFAAHFIQRDHGISEITLPEGKTFRGGNTVKISADYLKGELTYDALTPDAEKEIIRVPENLLTVLMTVYETRIVPLFGEYNEKGEKLQKGMIIFLENKDNPTGVRNWLMDYAKTNGEFIFKTSVKDNITYQRLIGYKPFNPDKFVIIITDHLRKLLPERGFKMKETVDKFSEYAVEFRNICKFTFVHIIHLNRALSDISRRQFDDDRLFPQSDDIKETGNLSEDSNYIFTMMNPNDDKYNLKKHFGRILRTPGGALVHPNLRTIHLVESRHCFCPQHFAVNMIGETKTFTKVENKK
jgi:hypothetical protein